MQQSTVARTSVMLRGPDARPGCRHRASCQLLRGALCPPRASPHARRLPWPAPLWACSWGPFHAVDRSKSRGYHHVAGQEDRVGETPAGPLVVSSAGHMVSSHRRGRLQPLHLLAQVEYANVRGERHFKTSGMKFKIESCQIIGTQV